MYVVHYYIVVSVAEQHKQCYDIRMSMPQPPHTHTLSHDIKYQTYPLHYSTY